MNKLQLTLVRPNGDFQLQLVIGARVLEFSYIKQVSFHAM